MSEIFVYKADLIFECQKCGEPSTGSFNSDDHEDDDYYVVLRCVSCGLEYRPSIYPKVLINKEYNENILSR